MVIALICHNDDIDNISPSPNLNFFPKKKLSFYETFLQINSDVCPTKNQLKIICSGKFNQKQFKMKFAVILLLACLSVCYVSSFRSPFAHHTIPLHPRPFYPVAHNVQPRHRTWGKITSRTLGTRNVIIPKTSFNSPNYSYLTFSQVIYFKISI